MGCNETENIAVAPVDISKLGISELHRILQHGIIDWLQFAG